MFFAYDDSIQMFLRSSLKQVNYLQKAHWKTIAQIAFSMQYRKYEEGSQLYSEGNPCNKMEIILQGMVEISMVYDKQVTVIERLGIGSVLNPFNFIAEEYLQVNFTVASTQAVVYEIDKEPFFRII